MNIKITSDSTCDLTPELIAAHNITLVPLGIVKGTELFSDHVDITPKDIFEHVASGGEMCKTSAVNASDYSAIFAPLSAEYDAVIHINIGSEFSCCYQNACQAAAAFPNVYVIDSCNLSTGQGLVVLEACKKAKTCTDINALCQELRGMTDRVEASFLIDRLDFLAKGGRCSPLMALGANVLKLKPCIQVIDGKMDVGKKYRGNLAKCFVAYIKDRLENRDDILWDMVIVTHSPIPQGALEDSLKAVAQYGHFEQVIEAIAGCTISCHCGPGTLGIMFVRSK